MNDQNKNNIREGLAKIALAIYALLTIATCAGVWNFCEEPAVKVMAGLLFACNAVVAVKLWKKSDPETKK